MEKTEAEIWWDRAPYKVDYRDQGFPCFQRFTLKEQAERFADQMRSELCENVVITFFVKPS